MGSPLLAGDSREISLSSRAGSEGCAKVTLREAALNVSYRLLLLLGLTVAAPPVRYCLAQTPFPAPLPDSAQNTESAAPQAGAAPGPLPFESAAPLPFSGGFQSPLSMAPQSGLSDSCMKDFIPLREEAERRGRLIKEAADRHAPPDEACKLIADFGEAEAGMIRYVESNATSCTISEQIAVRLKSGHERTEALQEKVCDLALKMPHGAPADPTGDFEGPPKAPVPYHLPGRS